MGAGKTIEMIAGSLEQPVANGRLAPAGLHGFLNEAQSVAEDIHQLAWHHAVAQRLLGVDDAF